MNKFLATLWDERETLEKCFYIAKKWHEPILVDFFLIHLKIMDLLIEYKSNVNDEKK